MHPLFIALLALWPLAEEEHTDSLRTTDIEEVVIVSTPKETTRLRQQPIASTSFSQHEMRQHGILGVKDLSAQVPGLFIPAYGSRLTTSVYVRGIGSRIGTPAVALYVDGVPQFSLAAYDINYSDVDRIDVLRGPQGTLYGRNSMGGVIRVYTKNPFHYQGTDISLAGSVVPNGFPAGRPNGGPGRGRTSLTHYHRISDKLAFSGNFFGDVDGGYFRNHGRGAERMDDHTDLGSRFRIILRPSESFQADFTAHFEWLKQGGYPYEYLGAAGTPTTPEPATEVGQVAYNRFSGYRRQLLNTGLNLEKRWSHATLTSTTGYQLLDDCMDLDQDFTTTDLYTLRQQQHSLTLYEELILRHNVVSIDDDSYSLSTLTGLTASHQWLRTQAPVTFHSDGLVWLNTLINKQANTHLPTITSHDDAGNVAYTMNFLFNNAILGSELAFPGTYTTPTSNLALFHQSTLSNAFGLHGLTITAGLRVDYERFALNYDAGYAFSQSYGLNGRLTYPDGSVNDGMMLVPMRRFEVADALVGNLHQDYLQLLPRVSLQYTLTPHPSSLNPQPSTLYLTLSRGYRSGGYNAQMFNELLQTRMQTSIMHNVADATVPVVQGVAAIPGDVRQKVVDLLTDMGTDKGIDVQGATWYRPESSWNLEAGSHLNLCGGDVRMDVAAFWMETRDQQVSQMSAGGLGRITVNNGRSRSLGFEASLRAQLTTGLQAEAAYAFTHACFLNPQPSTLSPQPSTIGQTVPFVPRNTLFVGLTRSWSLPAHYWMSSLSLHADYRGAGRIYWNQENTAWQNFAGTLNGRVTLYKGNHQLAFYASNILGQRYQTFYFETMQRAFAQYTRPMELGLELRLRF